MMQLRQIWLYRWPVACALALLLLGNVIVLVGSPAWIEYTDLRQEAAQRREKLQSLRAFELQSGDYETAIAKQAEKLAALKGRLRAAGDLNAAQRAVQEAALSNGVSLLEMRAASAPSGNSKKNKPAYKEQGLRVQVEGDYYAILRLLRQLERQRLTVGELRLQGDDISGRVRGEFLFTLCAVEAI